MRPDCRAGKLLWRLKPGSLNLALFLEDLRWLMSRTPQQGNRLMLRLTKLIAACVVLAFASAEAFAQSEVGSGQVKAIYGAWKLKCAQLAGAKQDKCALVQDLKLEDRPNMFLTVLIMRSFDSDKKILRIVAPLGVVLPAGLGLRIDGSDVGNVKFLKCWKFGCLAEVIDTDGALVSRFSSGQTASFIVFPTPNSGIGFPAPLAGFAEGLKGLN